MIHRRLTVAALVLTLSGCFSSPDDGSSSSTASAGGNLSAVAGTAAAATAGASTTTASTGSGNGGGGNTAATAGASTSTTSSGSGNASGSAAVTTGATTTTGTNSGSTTGSTAGGSGGTSSGGNSSGSTCTDSSLQILFNPMYSAYDGTEIYQIPSVVNGVDQADIVWSAVPADLVMLAPDPSTGGVMITTNGAGTVIITAQVMGSSVCGTATLNIEATDAGQWQTGNLRYNNGVIVHPGPGNMMSADGGFTDEECTQCHGPTAMSGPFQDIAHTPEQTGGFSDQDLIGIFTMGVVPDGGYFDPAIVSYQRWQAFHAWSMTSEEALGVVTYLRSLTPSNQDGTSSFGGHYGYPDGGHPHNGFPDGGSHHHGYPDGGNP